MDYNEMLGVVKKQNPEMPFKEQQQSAKKMYKNFKESQANFSQGGDNIMPEGAIKVGISSPDLLQAEKRIREKGGDINTLIVIARELIPDGALVKHGLEGVNTLVSWENEAGRRLPEIGFFRIYI
jgi:hypothetical protein